MTEEQGLEIKDLFSVRGKNVLCSGGGRGIGRMITEGYIENGANVYIFSRDGKSCAQTAEEINKKTEGKAGKGKCIALESVDLSKGKQACDQVVQCLVSVHRLSQLHVLVNNSGVAWGEPLESYSEKGFDKVFAVNVKSLFYLTVACLPLLRAAATPNNPSRVINIGSIAGIQPQSFVTFAYDASKAAVHHLTRSLANALSSDFITVNAIAPGLFLTKMGSQVKTYETEDNILKTIPLRRFGQPPDMAGVALWLSSPAGSWVSGIIVPVEGGQLLPGLASKL